MPDVKVGVTVILIRYVDNVPYVLMGKRKGSHGAGTWSFPGGHIDFGEAAIDTAIRELEEETGITEDKLLDIRRGPYIETVFEKENKHYITLIFTALIEATIEAELKEPDKCEGWEWFDVRNLPSPLFEPIDAYKDKISDPNFFLDSNLSRYEF